MYLAWLKRFDGRPYPVVIADPPWPRGDTARRMIAKPIALPAECEGMSVDRTVEFVELSMGRARP